VKTKLQLAALTLLLSTINYQLSTALGQGSLTPPGAPAPTMKSLDQIEARTPISSLPYTISVGGSYYLTGNLTAQDNNSIVIAASGVTLDLNGYTLYSAVSLAQNGGTAILLNSGITHVTIQNGHIFSGVVHTALGYSGPGFGSGITGGDSDITIRHVSVSGCLYSGISLGVGTSGPNVVESCVVQTVGNDGIDATTVIDSVALDCGVDGIYCDQASDSRGESTGNANGISAKTANHCFGAASSGDGIVGELTVDCWGTSVSGNGINVFSAENCYGRCTSGTGVNAFTAANCAGYCTAGGSYGILASYCALNCFGRTGGNGAGISAGSVQNCRGESSGSGYGVYSDIASGSYGYCQNSGGIGMFAANASYCVCKNQGGGVALQTTIASGCINVSGTTSATYKYNMP
jgi:hypothetical protein